MTEPERAADEFAVWLAATVRSGELTISDLVSGGHLTAVLRLLAVETKGTFRSVHAVKREIFCTEIDHLRCMRILHDLYLHPLLAYLRKVEDEALVFDSEVLTDLLQAVAFIVAGSEALLHELRSEVKDRSDLTASSFGRVFEHMVPCVRLYTEYVVQWGRVRFVLEQLRKLPPITAFLQQAAVRVAANPAKGTISGLTIDTSLDSLLIMPVQRVVKYVLLLDEMRLALPLSSDELPQANRALKEIRQTADRCNTKMREAEAVAAAVEFERTARLRLPRNSERRLDSMQTATFSWADSSNSGHVQAVLLSDYIVLRDLQQPSHSVKQPTCIPLSTVIRVDRTTEGQLDVHLSDKCATLRFDTGAEAASFWCCCICVNAAH